MIALILALGLVPTPRPARVYLPVLANVPSWALATALPARTATPAAPMPTAVTDWRRLEKNLMTPGAVVVLAPGEYCPSRVLHMAARTRLEAAGARLTCRGLYLHKSDGATVRGLTVTGTTGDGIQVSRSRDVLIDRVHVSRAGDGCLDVVEGHDDGRLSRVTIQDSTITDCRKGSLFGDQDQPQDRLLRIVLARVRYIRIGERSPKAHWAEVRVDGGTVEDYGSTAVDARLGAVIHVSGTVFRPGKQSGARFQMSGGGRVIEGTGNTYFPWGGMQ